MKIVLPWPDKRLNPNARQHWKALSQVKSKTRWDAALLTHEAMNGQARTFRQSFAGKTLIPVKVTFYPPDHRLRDDDNMVGSFKAMRDGIADALDVSDRRLRPTYNFADPEKPGRIEVEL